MEIKEMDTNKTESRRFPRFKFNGPIHYQVRGKPDSINTVTEDVSVNGLRFINKEFLAPQSNLMLELTVLSRVLRPIGKVVWSQPFPHANRFHIGIEFLEMEPWEKNFLHEFLNYRKHQLKGV